MNSSGKLLVVCRFVFESPAEFFARVMSDNEKSSICKGRLVLAFVLLFILSMGRVVADQCVANESCQEEYHTNGSSGSCQTEYSQLYCNGKYCDVTVTLCESPNAFSVVVSCECY